MLELAVLFIHAGDKMLVEDQTSYKEMVTTIIREADFDGEYRCSLDVLYTLEEGKRCFTLRLQRDQCEMFGVRARGLLRSGSAGQGELAVRLLWGRELVPGQIRVTYIIKIRIS